MTNNFEQLANNITSIQDILQSQAAHAINLSLTTRNWLIGCYIVEYEQNGEDRAQYGEQLLKKLAKRIGRRGLGERRLYEFRQMYSTYPTLAIDVLNYLKSNPDSTILRLTTAKSSSLSKNFETRAETTIKFLEKTEKWRTPSNKLFTRLSATHLIYLSNVEDSLKRAFYEQEAIRGCWTVKELDRQVSSLYFERMGLSKNKKALQKKLVENNSTLEPVDIIRDPISLEFLGLQSQDVFNETKLETAILNHLQQFLLEMGSGFCFEARQKRILIDKDYFKSDLIFYHRILKCHIIVDLKIDRFKHEYASQLNMYLNYYRHEIMQPEDNPPIGLLLCTDYGETTVQYATEGMSQNLFVSKYKLQLPSEEQIKRFLLENISEDDYKNNGRISLNATPNFP